MQKKMKSRDRHMATCEISAAVDVSMKTGFLPNLSVTQPNAHAPTAKPAKYDIVGTGNRSLLSHARSNVEEYENVPPCGKV